MGIRAFLAVSASEEVMIRAQRIIGQLAATDHAAVKWVDPWQLHLTLKFFGDIRYEATSDICRHVQAAVDAMAPFSANVVGVGAFPAVSRPRTIWAGFREGADSMIELAERVEKAVERLGYPIEHRRFQPHLTLGRVKGREFLRPLALEIESLSPEPFGWMDVEAVILFRSELVSSGPIYHRMATLRLGHGAQ